ncbi:hypothetical protein BCT47_00330 [Vibrio splendidus]|uniref:Uncharacterized protein n=1 Tax=Vibrio splendidus TaxID=29497 RepID=A0AB35MW64_VIBSP|nr:hypothetical protein [Vibrio splendidus]MCW4441543.1 hypothetical protein [Vibrio splendidus]MDH5898044.1 hypothetical protein [Vibrio splendidus]MDP2500732.1 hypothetical protein [Vibrio splendidus]PMM77915.1 hypothetical protein BCT47_00330 [Vibrio splendidus]
MAKLAGLYLHLDIPFDEIDEYEAEQYVKDIGKKYANLLYGDDLELFVRVSEGSIKVYLAVVGSIYLAIGQYGSFRSGCDYLIKDAKTFKELVVSELVKNGVSEHDIISKTKEHCDPDKIRRVLLAIERLESKPNLSVSEIEKELSKIKTSVRNICRHLTEKDVGLFASSIDSKYLPENTDIPYIAEQYKIKAREEDILFFPSSGINEKLVNKAFKRDS